MFRMTTKITTTPANMAQDRPEIGWFPSEGWAIFDTAENGDGGPFEVMVIDEESSPIDDDQARILAEAKGYKFEDENHPYRVTHFPETDAQDVETEDPLTVMDQYGIAMYAKMEVREKLAAAEMELAAAEYELNMARQAASQENPLVDGKAETDKGRDLRLKVVRPDLQERVHKASLAVIDLKGKLDVARYSQQFLEAQLGIARGYQA